MDPLPARADAARHRPARLALIGPYPPTPCGIATFTQSLRDALLDAAPALQGPTTVDVIRIVDEPGAPFPPEVVAEWVRGDPVSLCRLVDTLRTYDIVILQHEFGIFGGPDGDEVVPLVEACPVPLITILHTVLPNPSVRQGAILDLIRAASTATVVQSNAARELLAPTYQPGFAPVHVLPHGAVANFHGPTKDLAVADGPVLLTWGLLGPGKGIERAIQALADLPPDVPQPTYVVAGRTHPQVVAREGERYREGLSKLAADLGVGHLVVFDDDYRDWVELRTLVRSADVVVLPYDSHDQVTSGVLVEAVASGKPVVATAFPHACEVLQSGAGIVVAHDDGAALTAAFHVLTTDPGQRRRMADAARREAVELLWPRVGERYLELSAWSTRALDDVA